MAYYIKAFIVFGCVLTTLVFEIRSGHSVVATETVQLPEKQVTYCYFGAFRKDGRIMVNMVEGASGKLFRINQSTLVTLNGSVVGQQFLREGMPITLIQKNNAPVDEIQIRPIGGH